MSSAVRTHRTRSDESHRGLVLFDRAGSAAPWLAEDSRSLLGSFGCKLLALELPETVHGVWGNAVVEHSPVDDEPDRISCKCSPRSILGQYLADSLEVEGFALN